MTATVTILKDMTREQKADAWRALSDAGFEVNPQTGRAALPLDEQPEPGSFLSPATFGERGVIKRFTDSMPRNKQAARLNQTVLGRMTYGDDEPTPPTAA